MLRNYLKLWSINKKGRLREGCDRQKKLWVFPEWISHLQDSGMQLAPPYRIAKSLTEKFYTTFLVGQRAELRISSALGKWEYVPRRTSQTKEPKCCTWALPVSWLLRGRSKIWVSMQEIGGNISLAKSFAFWTKLWKDVIKSKVFTP